MRRQQIYSQVQLVRTDDEVTKLEHLRVVTDVMVTLVGTRLISAGSHRKFYAY